MLNEKSVLETFRKTTLSHGLVIRGTPDEFDQLLEVLKRDFPRLFIVYQKSSTNRLWIRNGSDPEDNTATA